MLPGIRFLLAAILLSISVVVFGLGAAALLRAAHEDFASNPSWRVTPETRFAQNETPTLALLSVETPPPAARPADVPDSVAPQMSATAPALPSEQLAAVSPAPATDAMKTEAPPPRARAVERSVARLRRERRFASARSTEQAGRNTRNEDGGDRGKCHAAKDKRSCTGNIRPGQT